MNIEIHYVAQIKNLRGLARETLELDQATTVRGVIDHLVRQQGNEFGQILLNHDGRLRPSILIFVDDAQVDPEAAEPLTDGQTLTLLSPMAGG